MAELDGVSETDFVCRLAKLELQNQRLRQGVALILTIFVTLLLLAQSPPKRTVEAEEFVLRDTNGRIRAKLGMSTAEPSLALYDSSGHVKVLIDGTGPAVHLIDANAIPRLSMMVDTSGANFSVSDTRGRLRGVFGTRDVQNATTVSFYDEKAIGRAAIGLVTNGPLITLQDASGKPIWTVPSTPNASAEMTSMGRHPRVFIETWEVTQIFKPQRAESFQEMQAFVERCPQAVGIINQKDSDYVLRFEHHYLSQGSGFYQYALFDATGGAIGTDSKTLSLFQAVDSSCKNILTDWAAKGR